MSISIHNRLEALKSAMAQDGNENDVKVIEMNNGHAVLFIQDETGANIASLNSYFDRVGIETQEGHLGFYPNEATAYNAALADLNRLAGVTQECVHGWEIMSAISNEDDRIHAELATRSAQSLKKLTETLQRRRNNAHPDLWLVVAEAARDIAKMAERAAHARP